MYIAYRNERSTSMLKRKVSLGLIVVLVMNLLMSMGALAADGDSEQNGADNTTPPVTTTLVAPILASDNALSSTQAAGSQQFSIIFDKGTPVKLVDIDSLNDPVAKENNYIRIHKKSDNSIFTNVNLKEVTLSNEANGNAKYSWSINNIPAGEYYITIGSRTFINASATDTTTPDTFYAGMSNATDWTFTVTPQDLPAPIIETVPTASTVSVILTLQGSIVDLRGAGEVELFEGSSIGAKGSGKSMPLTNIPIQNGAANVQFSGLKANTNYIVVVREGAFTNSLGGNSLQATAQFKTLVATTAPTLSGFVPATVDASVTPRPIISAVANQAITVHPNAAQGGIYLYKEGSPSDRIYTVGAGTNDAYVTGSSTLTFRPVQDLEQNVRYYVVISPGMITGTVGNLPYTPSSNWVFSTTSNDKIAPVIQDATVYNNSTIRLRYNEALYSTGNLSRSYFSVTVNGENRRISNAYASGEYVYVTLDIGIAVGQVVRISYTGSGTSGTIQDIARNAAAGFSNREVTNNIDSVLPKPRDGYINGRNVYLTFTESLKSISSSAYDQFTVTANGSTKSIRSITAYGSSGINLTLDSEVGNGEVVKVSYQPGSYPLQDNRSNNIAPFTDYFIRNYKDNIPPEFQGVEGAGNKITLTYNEPLRTTPLPLKSQFSVLVNNVAVYVTNVEIVSNQVILTLASPFTQDQAVTLSYVSGYGGTADLNGNLAGYINLKQVTFNNVAQGIRSAVVNGDIITITYNTTLRAVSFLPPNQFAVTVNNNHVGVQNATISGNTVTLKLSSQVMAGQAVTLSYMTGTTPLIDTSGNRLNTFSNMTVTHASASNNNNTTTTNGQPSFLSLMSSSTFNKAGYLLNISTAKPSTTQSNRGRSINRYTIDSTQMQTAFQFITTLAANRMLVFEVPQSERAAEVAIPLSALTTVSGGTQNISVAVKYKENLYEIPVDGISLSEITRALNVSTLNSAYLIIQMEMIERSQLGMPTISNGVSISTLIDPMEIRVVVMNGSGAANGGTAINHSGKYYLRMNGSRVTSAQSTLVNYNTANNSMEHMLSSTSGSNGNLLYIAKVERNSIIGPIMGSMFYSDINNHWAKSEINELTAKLVVGPRSTGSIAFDANRNITRGEFGEYIAKALGLTSDMSSNSFPDVTANLRGGYINSAVKAGIITGYPDGTFKPEQFITREQMALMMVRAMSYAKENITLNGTAAQTLSRFKDASGIQDKETVAKAVQSGIMQGMTATSFQPKGNATRAQAATMIRRVLSKINYL